MRNIIFYYLYPLQLSSIVPLIYGVANYRRLATPVLFFFWQLTFSLLIGIGMIIAGILHIHNIWLMNLSLPIDVGLILWMFSLWQRDPIPRAIARWLILAFACVWLSEIAFYDRLFNLTVIARPLEGALLILAACYTILKANQDLEVPIVELPQFWICFGILVYFGGMIIVNLLSNTLLKSQTAILEKVYLIQPALTLITNILFIGGFRCRSQDQISPG